MNSSDRRTARRHLDKRLSGFERLSSFSIPPRGWVRAIRDALGMTAAQLGRRLGVSQPRVAEIEKAEISGAITLESLRRAANALDCQLVYAFVPREPLETMVGVRAEVVARKRLGQIVHSMTLEAQRPDQDDLREQL